MTKSKQRGFVKQLSLSIVREIYEHINSGKIPESWDGHELRYLLGRRHDQSAHMSLIRKEPKSKRAKECKNTIIINNL